MKMPQPYVYHTSSLYVSSYFFIHVPLCPCRRNTGFPPRLKANQLYTLERLEQMVKMRRAQIKCAQWWTSAKWRGGGGYIAQGIHYGAEIYLVSKIRS